MDYTEKPGKLNLTVSNSSNPVIMTFDCYNGTLASVSFDSGIKIKVHSGETEIIGSAKDLKGKRIEFTGLASNPGNESIKVTHIIIEDGGNKLVYTFPNDYSGAPAYKKEDVDPSYTFFVNFI
jgi:hypothetical protein